MRSIFYSALLFLVAFAGCSRAAAQGTVQRRGDTVAIFFPLDVRTLTDAATRTLDGMRYREVLAPGKDLYIIGYADYVGRSSYNDTLSLARAEAVKRYLLSSGFKEERLRLVTGRGEVARRDSTGRSGFQPDRRVDIVPAIGGFLPPPAASSARIFTRDTSGAPVITSEATAKMIQRLLSAPVDSAVVMNNLYFPPGRHYVYPGSRAVLDALAGTLKTHPTLRIRIEGHVCCINAHVASDAIDDDTGEFALSSNRAKAVKNYLVSEGIAADRLEVAGFGKSRPVVMPERNATDTERNRRVEIRILAR